MQTEASVIPLRLCATLALINESAELAYLGVSRASLGCSSPGPTLLPAPVLLPGFTRVTPPIRLGGFCNTAA